MASSYPELTFSADEAFDERRLNAAMNVLDARLRAIEPFSPSWETAISELQSFGLKRLDDALRPVYEQVVAISQVGVIFSASSASELTVAVGAQTMILAEEDRARFAAAAYIGVMKTGDASVQMSGRLVSYDRGAGVLVIDVDHVSGAGTYADWRVSASVDGTIFQAVVDGLAEQVVDGLAAISDASNMTSGTLPAARLPTPTETSMGGVVVSAAPAKKFAIGIDALGALSYRQPAFTDLSGKATADQLPGDPAALRNLLRNASFAINQRGVSGTVTLAAGVYGHDGVKAGAAGATYAFSVAGIDTTILLGAGSSIILPIEGALIEGGAYTLSQAGTAQARVWQGTGNSGSGSYAAAPLTVSGLAAGVQTNVEFAGPGTVLLPQFESGTTAKAFERRPHGVELALCQRYFETGPEPYMWLGGGLTASAGYGDVRFTVTKRATPSIAMSGWRYYSFGTDVAFTPVAAAISSSRFGFNGTGLSNWNGWTGVGTWTASAELA